MREALQELRALARSLASDAEYLAWVRTQPSCISGHFCEWPNGDPRNPACHVRRAVDSGTSHKPEFSAVPMTNNEHADQTNRGESYCLGVHSYRYPWSEQEAKQWFDEQVRKHLIKFIMQKRSGINVAAALYVEY